MYRSCVVEPITLVALICLTIGEEEEGGAGDKAIRVVVLRVTLGSRVSFLLVW